MPKSSLKNRNKKPMGVYDLSNMSPKKLQKFMASYNKLHFVASNNQKYVITDNLLRNLVCRDVNPVRKSFDDLHIDKMVDIDSLFSETACLVLISHKNSVDIDEKYGAVLTGLLQNALNTFGGAVVLLQSGLSGQSMVLIRQVVELCSTIIHIVGDPEARVIDKFIEGKYHSTDSVGRASKAVPIIGHFWGVLSKSFVHINYGHTEIKPVRLHKRDDKDVETIITCLRMTIWICYLTAEIAFPTAREHNRYWKKRLINGRPAVEYAPSPEERDWAAKFLSLDDVGPNDLAGGDVNNS
ncbi:hypothetical protein [uncultured Methylobacterium sp.]|jgi:hypothetical protein|uniref:hypothetical protein n=1 Tax=uncultured Methylobacterium sp. TaxID=157278 RepID=UPI002628D62F|nr:hypothetical protein [uncultured Methylobacterium sp.]